MNPRRAPLSFVFVGLGLMLASRLLEADEIAAPGGANSAKNLARLNCGAHIERVLPGGRVDTFASADSATNSPGALMLDDNTLSCPLAVGDNTFIISLPRTSVLQRCAFVDRNSLAQGEFELAVSNYRLGSSDSGWKKVLQPTVFGKESIINVSMLGVEARYVRLTFHIKKEGHISALALYGLPTLASFSRVHAIKAQTDYSFGWLTLVTHLEDTLNFNYANQYANGRVVYVSSHGPNSPLCMIDDDATTSFAFAEDDPHPTVIVELADREMLHRISALAKTPDGQVDIYLLDDLATDPADLSRGRLIGNLTSKSRDGEIALNFDPQKARYVALRWKPDHGAHKAVDIAEIGIFGAVPLAIVNLSEDPSLYAQLSKPGESTIDLSTTLGTLAIPPAVKPISP